MDEFTKELKECAAGLRDGMGGHADYCAELMERAALMIAKLQEDNTAQSLALKAAKAMQQAETERADANGWIRAIDEDMVCAHIGIADGSDDYATAKKKLNDLIAWHVAVATDPAVNGGYKLVPVEPTEEQWGGLARDIMMSFDLGAKSPAAMLCNMRWKWNELPEWMRNELHDPESTSVLSKGTRAVLIYRAMLSATNHATIQTLSTKE